jgi:hypothetical protein
MAWRRVKFMTMLVGPPQKGKQEILSRCNRDKVLEIDTYNLYLKQPFSI